MTAAAEVTLFGVRDVLRNKWSIVYFLFFLLATDGLLRLSGDPSRAVLGLLNIVLYLIPLVSVVFGTMYFYNSREFFKLLLAQPVRRSHVFLGAFISLALSLNVGFTAGMLLPFVYLYSAGAPATGTLLLLLVVGWCLTSVFVGFAFWIAVAIQDRGKGIAIAILIWLALAILYDGVVLFGANLLSRYPLEKTLIGASLFNPIDLGRILLLLRMDVSALMGYTGAVFERFFGAGLGLYLSAATLILWSILPMALALRSFSRKDF